MTASDRITAAYSKLPEDIREITARIRAIIHKASPEITENWKWGPCFESNGIAIGLWGFKKHVTLVFYRGSEMSDKHKLFNGGLENAHNRMIKFSSLKEINEKKISDYVKEAVKRNASEKKSSGKAVKTIDLPAELENWFKRNKKAHTFFETLAFTYRKEMIKHITGAKQEETRKRRFKQITETLKSGKKEFR